MKAPTKARLKAILGLTEAQATLVRALAERRDDPMRLSGTIHGNCPRTDAWANACHSDPYDSALWRTTMALAAIDETIGTHGVECLGPTRSGDYAPAYEYCNAGDPYVATLIYDRAKDRLFIGSWGDIAEKLNDGDDQ